MSSPSSAAGQPPAGVVVTTTHTVEGRRILGYHGLVSGQAILGANVFRDLFASVRDTSAVAPGRMRTSCATPARPRSAR